ncbi:MFS transporter [Arthrobacter cavernae]|uniref:MFS transporter n=1 Tax=Arthrobacter cavernae TaxID=2817681 RepID=A0A939HJA8_9MICC|nr:MFS transporter [Arthrobacter cavernae]MBO1269253.1 MFS transporter [Arthrobacter cavernae]
MTLTDSLTTRTGSPRLPLVVPLLAVGTFLMITTEFIVAGLIQEMASDLGVGVAQIGLLITAFAVGMIVGAPGMAVVTLRLPRRATLVAALAVFALGHVVAALSTSFAVVLAARVLTALVTGAFWAVASVVATKAAGPAASSRALGVMMSGVGLATVAGVPLGSWLGQSIGWRGAFWAIAVLATVAAIVIGRFAPADEKGETASVLSELNALRDGRTWLLFGATALISGAVMATFSFISPLLTDRTGLPGWAVPLVLAGFGVGALIGTNAGGRFGDRRPVRTFVVAALIAGVVLLLLIPLSALAAVTVVLVFLLGISGMAIPPVATGMAVAFARNAPTLAAALAVSAFNAGTAVGSVTAGEALKSDLGAIGPAVVSVVMVVLGLIPLVVLAAKQARRDRPTLDTAS